jgi:hypothetical protein
MDLDTLDLTDKQFDMALAACPHPIIIKTPGAGRTAAALARKGWGEVEPGASGERIFRISQAGCDSIQSDAAAFKGMA